MGQILPCPFCAAQAPPPRGPRLIPPASPSRIRAGPVAGSPSEERSWSTLVTGEARFSLPLPFRAADSLAASALARTAWAMRAMVTTTGRNSADRSKSLLSTETVIASRARRSAPSSASRTTSPRIFARVPRRARCCLLGCLPPPQQIRKIPWYRQILDDHSVETKTTSVLRSRHPLAPELCSPLISLSIWMRVLPGSPPGPQVRPVLDQARHEDDRHL